jgi:hypothetical protein
MVTEPSRVDPGAAVAAMFAADRASQSHGIAVLSVGLGRTVRTGPAIVSQPTTEP